VGTHASEMLGGVAC